MTSSAAGYRPHLDGIRALAVVAVMVFHLGFSWLPAGFVGVDVFFVLSGYLITGLLLGEATSSDTVSLRRFYARRARRLLPASLAVLLAVIVATWLFLDPVGQQSVGHDATFAALYSANWRFALVGGDYFALGDVPSPLVHYWSLAVEEQFYLVWPAAFLGVWRLARRTGRPVRVVFGATVAVGLASAAASVLLAPSATTYYGTHTRAYQLLAGAALALAARRVRERRTAATTRTVCLQVVGVIGALTVLGGAAATVTDASAYPGIAAIVVTAASLVLIASVDVGGSGPAAALIGSAPLAAIGRLSYSLYIWHWPIIVFGPVLAQRWHTPVLDDRPVLIAAIIAAAGASYLIIERPIRFHLRPRAPSTAVVATGVSLSVLVAIVGVPILQPDDPFETRALAAVRDLAKPGECPYFPEDWPTPERSEPCSYREGQGITIAIVGDSHAQQWQPAFEALAAQADMRIVRVTRGGCPANDRTVYHFDDQGIPTPDDECTSWRHRVYRDLIDVIEPDVVFVATRSHVLGIRADGRDVAPADAPHLGLWTEGWDWTLDTLASGGARVVVSEILPTLPQRVPACLAAAGEDSAACDFPVAGDQGVTPFNDAIAGLRDGRPRVSVVDPTPIACPGGMCRALDGDVVIHRDDNHLSATFVRSRADAFADLLLQAGVPLG